MYHALYLCLVTAWILGLTHQTASAKYQAIGRYEKQAAVSLRAADSSADAAYQNAITDAAIAQNREIYSQLTALTDADPDLKWWFDGATTRVLLVTWTGWDGYLGQEGLDMTMGIDVWTTPFPEMRDFAANRQDLLSSATALNLRLAQVLGLPPDTSKDYVVEMWVDIQDIFRPSADPEVTDTTAELQTPRSDAFTSVSLAHQQWISDLQAVSYGPDGYPWTRLGYTYDWANPNNPVGFSEFVVRQGAQVRIHSVQTTLEYANQSSYHMERTIADFLAYAEQARQDWLVPALAIGIVHKDEVLLTTALGTKEMGGSEPCTTATVFQIGSISKSFTTAMLAKLVADGELNWSDQVRDHLPTFDLQNENVAAAFTLADLPAQHSGLPGHCTAGMGILGFNASQKIDALSSIKPVGVFRQDYAYQNILFSVIQEVMQTRTGLNYEGNLQSLLFTPLGMTSAGGTVAGFLSVPDQVSTHFYIGGHISNGLEIITPANAPLYDRVDRVRAAGSVYANITDMVKYLRFQIAKGSLDGLEVVPAQALSRTHQPQTMITSPLDDKTRYYCMGWVLSDTEPTPTLFHNGDTTLCKAVIAFQPAEELGIVLLTNVGGTDLPDALAWQFFDMYHDIEADYSREWLQEARAMPPTIMPDPPAYPSPARALTEYIGIYQNSPCGEVNIRVDGDGLDLEIGPQNMVLDLEHWDGDTFAVTNPFKLIQLNEEVALVHFHGDEQISSMTLDLLLYDNLKDFTRTATLPTSGVEDWNAY